MASSFFRKVTASTAGAGGIVALNATSLAAPRGIQLKADPANTANVWVSNSGAATPGTVAATDGFPIGPSESYFVPPCANDSTALDASAVYIVSTAASQGVYVHVL